MKWIKIEDEQPIIGRDVIAVGTWWGDAEGVGDSEYMGIGVWDGDCVNIDSGIYIQLVTRWMYIPSHPKD